MTVRNRRLIDATDILGFVFVCKKCRAELSIPANYDRPIPDRCMQCGATWFFVVTDKDPGPYARIKQAIHDIKGLAGAPCAFSIEITTDEEPPADTESTSFLNG